MRLCTQAPVIETYLRHCLSHVDSEAQKRASSSEQLINPGFQITVGP